MNGVLFTAQAAGRQMARFGNGGSIVLVASMSGSITNKVRCVSRPAASAARPRAIVVLGLAHGAPAARVDASHSEICSC